MEFTLSVVNEPPATHLTVRGELDLVTARVLAATMNEQIEAGCRRLLIDLADVTFVDASALTTFTQTRRVLADREGTMEFVAFQPTFLRLCRATGLVDVFGLA